MNTSNSSNQNFPQFLRQFRPQRGLLFGVLIIAALLAFEIFNYSTTDYALGDLLGNLQFAGVYWSTILAIAFCGIDFAGIARLFTPQEGNDEPSEVWYLFGAWMLAATMNAMLTWWGVSLAIVNHQTLGNEIIDRSTMLRVVPIFVAVMVWVIRVLIIGTFSVAGDRLFSVSSTRAHSGPRFMTNRSTASMNRGTASRPPINRPSAQPISSAGMPAAPAFKPSPKPGSGMTEQNYNRPDSGHNRPETNHNRPEPTYHPLSMSGRSNNNTNNNGNGNSNNRRQG